MFNKFEQQLMDSFISLIKSHERPSDAKKNLGIYVLKRQNKLSPLFLAKIDELSEERRISKHLFGINTIN
jgi:hypothetical protein